MKQRFDVLMERWPWLKEELRDKKEKGVKKNDVMADWLTELEVLRKLQHPISTPLMPVEAEDTEAVTEIADDHAEAKSIMDLL